jgi:hypothetical protein
MVKDIDAEFTALRKLRWKKKLGISTGRFARHWLLSAGFFRMS